MMNKKVEICVQDVVGGIDFWLKSKDGYNIEVLSFFLMYMFSEEGVGHEVNDPISDRPKKVGEMLTIDFNTVYEGGFMF